VTGYANITIVSDVGSEPNTTCALAMFLSSMCSEEGASRNCVSSSGEMSVSSVVL